MSSILLGPIGPRATGEGGTRGAPGRGLTQLGAVAYRKWCWKRCWCLHWSCAAAQSVTSFGDLWDMMGWLQQIGKLELRKAWSEVVTRLIGARGGGAEFQSNWRTKTRLTEDLRSFASRSWVSPGVRLSLMSPPPPPEWGRRENFIFLICISEKIQ